MNKTDILKQLTIIETPAQDELNWLQAQLDEYRRVQTNGAYDQPGVEINLVIKDQEGTVVGGVIASTVLRVMHLEVLWVAEKYRKLGLGRDLVLAAEKIGYEQGCMSAQTMTFSFQAPFFYEKIGYKLLGVYDGYPFGIRESVLLKRLQPERLISINEGWQKRGDTAGPLLFTTEITPEEIGVLHTGLHRHVVDNIGDKYTGIKINLVAKDAAGKVVGGLMAITTIQNMLLELLWIDEPYRRKGLGTHLLTRAEQLARQSGCLSAFTYVLSFLTPTFFHNLGYRNFAVSDGYPEPFKEYYMIKNFV